MLTEDRILELTQTVTDMLEVYGASLKSGRTFLVDDRNGLLNSRRDELPFLRLAQAASLGGLHTELCAVYVPAELALVDSVNSTQVGKAPRDTDQQLDLVFVECRYPF